MRLIDADALLAKKYINEGKNMVGVRGWITFSEIEDAPTVSPWHRVEEEPKESGKQYAVWASKGYAYCDKWLGDRWLISSVAPETVTHWMPIEPPKEDA